jgi:peptide/nickel transport system permease protein
MSLRFVGRKIVGSILTLFVVLVFNFFLFRIVKSDPVANLFRGRHVPDAVKVRMRHQFGLDKSKWDQFWLYLNQTLRGNLGSSYRSGQPVTHEIAGTIWPTVWLVGLSTVLSTAIGLLLGIKSAWQRNSWFDRISTGASMFTYATPDFFLGILLLAGFAFGLKVLPTGGIENPGATAGGLHHLLDQGKHLILPCLTLTIGYMGEYAIVMRSSLLEVMGEDFLKVARARGLRDALVRRRHAVPNALLPTVTLVTLNLGFVLSGAIAVETVYSWPGLGKATADALRGPDFPMLQGLFLLFTAAIIVANLVSDLLYGYLDPRVRVG